VAAGWSFAASAVAEPPAAAPGGVAGVAGVAAEDALEPDAELGGVAGVAGVALEAALEEVDLSSFFSMPTDAEPETEPGAPGVVVEPAEEDEEPDGGVVFETARSLSLSQPVSNPAPSARDTAIAKVESLMCGPPWLG
jgi:hypothetical protein